MVEPGGPVAGRARIGALDMIRGFALFGVLWMNLFEHAGFVIPADQVMPVAPDWLEQAVRFLSNWLMLGKAQALFSILFGFGFALFLARADAAGGDGQRRYLRRLTFLLVLGALHATLLWAGDILHAYALVGFLRLLTRRWPNWLLLTVGLVCSQLVPPIVRMSFDLLYPAQTAVWNALGDQAAVRMAPVFLHGDYPAYVGELVRSWREYYGTPGAIGYAAQIFGRFLLGQWLFRQGWLRDEARERTTRRLALPLLAAGLALSATGPMLGVLALRPTGGWLLLVALASRLGLLLLALGYAAGIVALCRWPAWRRVLGGLGAAGQMALTNYLVQSVFFFGVLYGFGLGLLPRVSPVFCLAAALGVFAVQIGYSRWWLARYRFGPAEWLWRGVTYGARQPLRR
jgi:uncharacterized protein